MHQVIQMLALLAMVCAAVFSVLALVDTGRWAARRLDLPRTFHPHKN